MHGQSVSIGVPSAVGEAAEICFTIASQFFRTIITNLLEL